MVVKERQNMLVVDLEKARLRLSEALQQPRNDFIRDSVVQRFEFTFELAWKAMKLTMNYLGLTEINSPREVILEATVNGLIENTEKWLDFLEFRNWCSHMYGENRMDEAYDLASDLMRETELVLAEMKKRVEKK